jgi:hypothetical protein
MLDNHPQVAVPLDTTGLWARFEKRLGDYGDLATEANRGRIVGDLLKEERISLWKAPLGPGDILERWKDSSYPGLIQAFYEAYAATRGKVLWGDKDPGNMTRMDQLHRWFPDGRFIHIIRDGRDACLSHLTQSFGFENMLECAVAWREEVQWVRRIGAVLGPERYHELRYEDLVAAPEDQLKSICTFLGIQFSPAMLKYHETVEQSVPDEKRHIWPLLDQPPRSDNAGRWKQRMSNGARVCFEKRAGQVLAEMGYETLPHGASGAYLEEVRNLAGSAFRTIARKLRRQRGN